LPSWQETKWCQDLGARGISLPSGADLDRNQVARVVRALGEALDR
jgi:dTDP-4-amino-4,6-dideoxygalactose transaminase